MENKSELKKEHEKRLKDCCYNNDGEYKQEEIFKALNADKYVNWCKWTDNKVLIINITPAP